MKRYVDCDKFYKDIKVGDLVYATNDNRSIEDFYICLKIDIETEEHYFFQCYSYPDKIITSFQAEKPHFLQYEYYII